MVVLLDKPRNNIYGGSTAAPVFSNIVRRLLSVRPDLFNKKEASKKQNSNQLEYTPSFVGLFTEDAVNLARTLGLNIKFEKDTSGIVISQFPKPTDLMNISSTITLGTKPQPDSSAKPLEKDVRLINVRGLSLRRGLAILSNAGVKVKVIGSGIIEEQSWGRSPGGEVLCTITCKPK